MNGERLKLSTADVIALVCLVVIGITFVLLPWLKVSEVDATGLRLLTDVELDPQSGVAGLWVIPLAAIIGSLVMIWRLFYTPARQGTPIVLSLVGILGLVYYLILLIFEPGQSFMDIRASLDIGFWVALLALLGLALQVFTAPSPRDIWTVLPFEVNLRNREIIVAYAFLAPFLILFSIFVVRAVASALQMSLYEYHIMRPVRPFIWFDNYKELLNDYVWWQSLKNTLIFTALTVTGTTTVALGAAVAVTQPIKGRDFFRVLLYMPSLFSVGAVGLVWVWLLNTQFGIINYALSFFHIRPINWLGDPFLVIPAISLTTIWWGFGFPMLIFIAGLQGIPEQLYEAARIDGASNRQLFFHITLPLLRPTILFITVTGVIAHFQVFGQVLILSNGGPGRSSYSVIFYLYQIAWVAYRMGYGSAVAVTLAAIMATFTALQFFVIGRRVEY